MTDYIKSALSKQVVPVTQNDGICGFHAREDNFCVEHMFTRFPTHKSTEEGIEDLRCELRHQEKMLLQSFRPALVLPDNKVAITEQSQD